MTKNGTYVTELLNHKPGAVTDLRKMSMAQLEHEIRCARLCIDQQLDASRAGDQAAHRWFEKLERELQRRQ